MTEPAWYIVVGRIPFDEEDTLLVVLALDTDTAIEHFTHLIYDLYERPLNLNEVGEPIGDDSDAAVFINYVVRCASQPEIVLQNA